jgi:hypothetical protein
MREPGTYAHLKRGWITMALSFAMLAASAQAAKLRVTADRVHIFPGERIVLTLEAEYPSPSGPATLPILPDSFRNLEVLQRANATSTQNGKSTILRQELTLTGFESGQWTIPPLNFIAGKEKAHSDSLRVTIDAVKLTDSTYHDIRDIIEVQEVPFDWKKWGAILLTLLIVGGIGWNYLRGRRKRPAPDVSAADKGTAYDMAQKELKKLKEEALPAKGEMKLYYTRLYDIFRDYLRKQGGHPDMQRTTGDLLLRLKQALTGEQTSELAQSLRIADAVKFAKYPSSPGEAANAHDTIDQTIRTLHQQKTGLDQ